MAERIDLVNARALPPHAGEVPVGALRARTLPPHMHGCDGFVTTRVLLALGIALVGGLTLTGMIRYIPSWVRNHESFQSLASVFPVIGMTLGTLSTAFMTKCLVDASRDRTTVLWKDARDTHRDHPKVQAERAKKVGMVFLMVGLAIGGALAMRSGWGDMDLGSRITFPIFLLAGTGAGAGYTIHKLRQLEDGDEDTVAEIEAHIDKLHTDMRKFQRGDALLAKPEFADDYAHPQIMRYYRASLTMLQDVSRKIKPTSARAGVNYRLAQIHVLYFHRLASEPTADKLSLEQYLANLHVRQYIQHGPDSLGSGWTVQGVHKGASSLEQLSTSL